jgi:crotonobetainyl-CoA:carnitine CoA-transferase CaiB-like acyl-CoA transferase
MTAFPILTPEQVLDESQLRERGFVVGLDHPEVEQSFIFALPWKEALRPRTGYRRAPLLAEDDEWMDKALERSGDSR